MSEARNKDFAAGYSRGYGGISVMDNNIINRLVPLAFPLFLSVDLTRISIAFDNAIYIWKVLIFIINNYPYISRLLQSKITPQTRSVFQMQRIFRWGRILWS